MEDTQKQETSKNDSFKKEWYKKWWGALIALLILPYFLLWYMWVKTSWNNVIKIIVTILFVIIGINMFGDGSENAEKKVEFTEPKKEITHQERLENIVIKIIKQENLKSVSYLADEKIVKVEFNPHSKVGDTSYAMTDEASFVRGAYENLVVVGREIFKIEDVEKFDIVEFMDVTDNYGKISEVRGVEILFSKDEFNKFNWDNFKLLSVYKEIKSSALDYYVNPQLMKAINPDKDLFLYFSK